MENQDAIFAIFRLLFFLEFFLSHGQQYKIPFYIYQQQNCVVSVVHYISYFIFYRTWHFLIFKIFNKICWSKSGLRYGGGVRGMTV